ncbi:MAG: radical SAM protein [Planctomycetota bacterium]
MNPDFDARVFDAQGKPLTCLGVSTLQVNITLRCNQACAHCHLRAEPDRDESMTEETVREVLDAVERMSQPAVDITGGAPELNENLSLLVREARNRGCEVMVRTNLTVLADNWELSGLYADNGVRLVASLPCYSREKWTHNPGAVFTTGVLRRSGN